MLVPGLREGPWSDVRGPLCLHRAGLAMCLSWYCCSAAAVGQSLPCGVLESEQSQLSSFMPKARSDPETGGNPGRFHSGGEAEAQASEVRGARPGGGGRGGGGSALSISQVEPQGWCSCLGQGSRAVWCSWGLPCGKAQGPGGQVRAGGAGSHQATSAGGCNESVVLAPAGHGGGAGQRELAKSWWVLCQSIFLPLSCKNHPGLCVRT